MTSFSRRNGYSGQAAPITLREDAPKGLRHAIVQIAAEEGFERSDAQRALICRVLRKMADHKNSWSDPAIASEVEALITACTWYRVYDIAEAFYAAIANPRDAFNFGARPGDAPKFESKLNDVLNRGNPTGGRFARRAHVRHAA